MKTSITGRKFIEQFEGLSLNAYQDSGGIWTIGYGHTSAAGSPHVEHGQRITSEQADQILGMDLGKVEQEVLNAVYVPLEQCQFDALVSFHFNCGAIGKIAPLLNAHNFEGAANLMGQWTHDHQGHLLSGLQRRRTAERAMFLNIDI